MHRSEPLISREPGASYETLRAAFEWSLPKRFNLGEACTDAQRSHDAAIIAVAIDGTSHQLTFGELTDGSARLAAGLRTCGIRRGDRVGVVVPQSPATALIHLAAWRVGAVSIPLAALFGTDALRYRLRDAGARLVLTTRKEASKVREAVPEIDVRTVEDDFEALLAHEPVRPVDTAAEDAAFLIYTSGTTGHPKGALHAHRSLFGHLPAFELLYEFAPQPRDVIWTPADWAWIGGLMDVAVPAWYHGIPVITDARNFEPQRAVDLMADHGVTLAFLPPTALKMMRAADASRSDLSLRAIFSGGEPLGREMLAWASERLGASINEGYGQTEVNLVVGNCGSAWPVRPGSMGRAFPGHDVAVFDDDGKRLIGAEGEICVRMPDPVAMLGYWNQPEATEQKLRDGWFRTGDLGVEDEDSYLWFRSRRDDVINSMGYRIGPGEIEDCIMGHPAVAMCAVIGIPDEIRGEVPAAFVVLRSPADASEALVGALQDRVRQLLAAHEVPRQITFVDDLPRTTTGKILRRKLRVS